MGNTANEDKRMYVSRQATIDELQVKALALLNIEKVLDFFKIVRSIRGSNPPVRILVHVSSNCSPWKRKRMRG
jgi:hypothetical protein